VHSSTGELPTPKSTQDVRPNFTHLQASQARSLGLGVGNSAHSSNITYHFSKIAFHSPHQFRPQDHHQNRKNISYPMVWGPLLGGSCWEGVGGRCWGPLTTHCLDWPNIFTMPHPQQRIYIYLSCPQSAGQKTLFRRRDIQLVQYTCNPCTIFVLSGNV